MDNRAGRISRFTSRVGCHQPWFAVGSDHVACRGHRKNRLDRRHALVARSIPSNRESRMTPMGLLPKSICPFCGVSVSESRLLEHKDLRCPKAPPEVVAARPLKAPEMQEDRRVTGGTAEASPPLSRFLDEALAAIAGSGSGSMREKEESPSSLKVQQKASPGIGKIKGSNACKKASAQAPDHSGKGKGRKKRRRKWPKLPKQKRTRRNQEKKRTKSVWDRLTERANLSKGWVSKVSGGAFEMGRR